MSKRTILVVAIACAALQTSLPAAAEEADKCCLRITPYLWAAGLDGELKAGGEEVNASADFADVVDKLDIGGSVMAEFNVGHWANFLQFDYMSLSNDDIDTRNPGVQGKMEIDSTFAAAATGYRFETGERSHVDVMVGVRYAGMDVEASLRPAPGNGVESNKDIIDGIVMLRPRIALSRYWSFSPTLSAGAGDSDLVWEMAPELVYTNDCCNLEFRFGYRSLNYKFEDGDEEVDLSTAGPIVGVGFAF